MAYPSKYHWPFIILAGFILCLFSMLLCVTLGPAGISLEESFLLVLAGVPWLGSMVDTSSYPATHLVIIHDIRMPRVILAALVGAALSAVGTTLQGLFKNPMADPYIIGVSSGAALGAAIAIVLGAGATAGKVYWALPAAAFIGALLSTWLVYNIARINSRVSVYTLLLSGVAISALNGAIMSFIMILNSSEMQQIVFWLLGSFSGKGWHHVAVSLPLILFCIAALLVYARELNAMLFGEDTAQHLGINTEKLKKMLLTLTALAVAAAVAVSGTIGFVGLVVPHMVRLLVGPDHRILLPAAVLTGAIFMVTADTLARMVLAPVEIPVGIITAFVGGPFFIFLLRNKKNNV